MLVRIMTDATNSIYDQFHDIFRDEGVELVVEPRVFEQIAELAIEYKTGRPQPARHLRGTDHSRSCSSCPTSATSSQVVYTSLFTDPTFESPARTRRREPRPADAHRRAMTTP